MKFAEQTMSESSTSSSARASSVLMGRQDYVSVMLRLIGMELYKIRRRLMSKILSIISIISTIGVFSLTALAAFLMATNGVPAGEIARFSESLRLPQSLDIVVQLLLTLGQILIIILVSTIVGGEYSDKTVRLMFTRGPTRTQYLLAKAGAALSCIIIGVIGLTVLGILTGLLLNLTTGIAPDFAFFGSSWLGHMLLMLLITIFGLLIYAMMALFLSTLGRTTAAGMAGVLTWSFLIEPVISVIGLFGRNIGGPLGSFFQALPDYLIGPNINILVQNQSQYLSSIGAQVSQQTDLHALLVLSVYLVVFLGLSCWVNVRRDVII
jgi:ABC-type transport system involved in multi-copper enzyme maturation permease subunit